MWSPGFYLSYLCPCCFATCEIKTKITHLRPHKQFANPIIPYITPGVVFYLLSIEQYHASFHKFHKYVSHERKKLYLAWTSYLWILCRSYVGTELSYSGQSVQLTITATLFTISSVSLSFPVSTFKEGALWRLASWCVSQHDCALRNNYYALKRDRDML